MNDREKLDEFVNFLEKLAAGLNELAEALDRLVEANARGLKEPFFTEDAARIARELGAYVTKFVEDHPYVADFSTKIGLAAAAFKFLLILGMGEIASTGVITAILAQAFISKNK